MQFRGDSRAQSVQVGAILLFGILIITLATFQATVVPDQNAQVEFDHSRTVQSDMQELRNGILRASSGPATPVRMTLGTDYPSRFLFINPPPPSGRIRTVGGEDPAVNVTLQNSSGGVPVGSDYENAELYWETADRAGLFNTSQIVYTPNYAEYGNAPTTVYENSLLYNRFANGQNRTLSGQQLVQGTTVNLLALRGDLQAARSGAYTVEVTTISESARTVTVRSEVGDPLYINITSALPAARWNEADLLGSQPRATASDAGTVTLDGETYHRVAIKLEAGETYKLRTSAVGVGALRDDEIITDPAYLVVTEEYQPVANGSDGSMTVEVRDRFNNPVTGAQVNVSADGEYLELFNSTDSGDSVTFETDAEGRATITYRGNNTTTSDEAWLNASINDAAQRYEYRNVTGIEVAQFGGGGDDGGGEINPGARGELIQNGATLNGGDVDITFNNTDDGTINVTAVRLNFYYHFNNPGGGGGGGGNQAPTQADVAWDGSQANGVEIGGGYVEFDTPVTIPVSGEPPATVNFDEDAEPQDFFVLTLVYEIDGQTKRTTYFISPENP